MVKLSRNNLLFSGLFFLWVLISVAFYQISNRDTYLFFESILSIIEIAFDIAILIFCAFLYYEKKSDFKIPALLLFFSFLGILLTDLNSYIILTVYHIKNITAFYASFYILPFFFFILFQFIFWSLVVFRNLLNQLEDLYIFILFIIVTLFSVFIYLMASTWSINFFSYLGLYDVVTGAIELLLFNMIVMAWICSRDKGLAFICSGLAIMIATNLWEKYLFDGGKLVIFNYSDTFWLLSRTLIIFSLFHLWKTKPKFSTLTGSFRKIRSKISLWIFYLMDLSYLILFFVGYSVGLISKNSLMSLPFLMTMYAVFIVLISSYIGRRFERPFENLKNDIKLLTNEKSSLELSKDLAAEEFFFLQKFIVNAFKIEDERNKERKAIADMAMQVAHDIRSPVSAVMMLAKECSELPENQKTSLLEAANRIQDIANYLLNRYGKNIVKPKISD